MKNSGEELQIPLQLPDDELTAHGWNWQLTGCHVIRSPLYFWRMRFLFLCSDCDCCRQLRRRMIQIWFHKSLSSYRNFLRRLVYLIFGLRLWWTGCDIWRVFVGILIICETLLQSLVLGWKFKMLPTICFPKNGGKMRKFFDCTHHICR